MLFVTDVTALLIGVTGVDVVNTPVPDTTPDGFSFKNTKLPLIWSTVVPVIIPVPEMRCPATIPVVDPTVITLVPKIPSPDTSARLTVSKVIVEPRICEIRAPAATPVPTTGIPIANPVLVPTIIVAEPAVPAIEVIFSALAIVVVAATPNRFFF